MITAALQLAGHGVTTEQARGWVMANLGDPARILAVASEFGVTTGMLAEIAGGGTTSSQVVDFFAAHGLDGVALDSQAQRAEVFPVALGDMPEMLTLNARDGLLSTASLRAEAQQQTGELAYWELFSPNRLEDAIDGVLSIPELGSKNIGDLAATPANIESMFYGTLIKLIGRVDSQELAQMQAYLAKNMGELEGGDKSAMAGYVEQLSKALADPAGAGALSDEGVRELIVDAVTAGVRLVGTAGAFDLLVPVLIGPM